MTVSTTATQHEYEGNGLNTVFLFYFQAFDNTVRAVVDGVVYTGPQTVNFNSNQESNPGGSFIFGAGNAPADGAMVIIERATPLTQFTDYPPYTRFPAKDHENALDKLTMIDQEQQFAIDANEQAIEDLQNVNIISSDPEMINVVDPTLMDDVTLNINTNVPNGVGKLDANGEFPTALIPREFPGPNPNLANTDAALITGTESPFGNPHIAYGVNTIQAKNNFNSAARLNLNTLGGSTHIGSAGTGVGLLKAEGVLTWRAASSSPGVSYIEFEHNNGNTLSQFGHITATADFEFNNPGGEFIFNKGLQALNEEGTTIERVLTVSDLVGGGTGDLRSDGTVPMTADFNLDDNSLINLHVGSFGPGGTDLSISGNGDADTGLVWFGNNHIQMVANADDFSAASAVQLIQDGINLNASATQIWLRNGGHPTEPDTMQFRLNGSQFVYLRLGEFDSNNALRFTNALDPVDPQDLVTRSYADANYSGGGDFFADGSVPMTGSLKFDAPGGTIEANVINDDLTLKTFNPSGNNTFELTAIGTISFTVEDIANFYVNSEEVVKIQRGFPDRAFYRIEDPSYNLILQWGWSTATGPLVETARLGDDLSFRVNAAGGGGQTDVMRLDGTTLHTYARNLEADALERVLTESDITPVVESLPKYLPLITQISKTSDTAYQQIPEFSFLADADSDYAVTGLLLISNTGGGSGGGKFNIFSDVTINTTGQVTWSQPTSTNNFSASQNGASLSVNFPATIASVGVQVSLNLVVRNNVSGVPAPISMYFAQNASDPVPSVLLLGSYVQIKKLVPPQIVAPLAVAHNNSPYVTVFDQNDGWAALPDVPSPPTGNGRGVDINNDNSLMAVGHFTTPYLSVFSMLHDYYKLPNVASLPENRVSHLKFSPDGSLLACAIFGSSPYIAIYNTATWTRLANPGTLPTGDANGVAWSPDGNYLAISFASAPYCHVYETATWTLVGSPTGLTANSRGCAFSPDSSMLAVNTDAPQTRIYSVPALGLLQNLTVPSTLRLYQCDWKPDQSELAVGRSSNSTLTIYETTGWTFTEILADSQECFAVAYSPDGAYIALGQAGGNRIYETTGYTETDELNQPTSNYGFSIAWGNP